MQHNVEVSELLKERVMNDISLIILSLDITDLFVVKYPKMIKSLFTFNKM